jgi:hypothetical protein
MTDPMQVGRGARVGNILIRKDAANVNTTSSAKAGIATLHLSKAQLILLLHFFPRFDKNMAAKKRGRRRPIR